MVKDLLGRSGAAPKAGPTHPHYRGKTVGHSSQRLWTVPYSSPAGGSRLCAWPRVNAWCADPFGWFFPALGRFLTRVCWSVLPCTRRGPSEQLCPESSCRPASLSSSLCPRDPGSPLASTDPVPLLCLGSPRRAVSRAPKGPTSLVSRSSGQCPCCLTSGAPRTIFPCFVFLFCLSWTGGKVWSLLPHLVRMWAPPRPSFLTTWHGHQLDKGGSASEEIT